MCKEKKSNWKTRIQLGLKAREQIHRLFPEQNEQDDVFLFALNEYKEYINSEEFAVLDDEDKEEESIKLLYHSLKDSALQLQNKKEDVLFLPPTYMTKQQTKQKLINDYLEAMERGSEDVASMNINDWIENERIIMMDEKDLIDLGIISSSSSNDENKEIENENKTCD